MKKRKYLLNFLPALIMMLCIFYFSSQDATKSSGLSSGILEKLFGITEKGTKEVEVINSSVGFELFETILRKAAHMTEYAILALTVYYPVLQLHRTNKAKIIPITLTTCIFYAMTDEIHQLFVPGRSAQITDVFIDGFGSLIGCIMIILIRKYLKPKNN